MDFGSLSRRELQALCKKNKIPANMTNVAMADALAALPQVEGIEEFLNAEESEVPESPKKEEIVCPEIPRTALRTSTRRKAIKEEPKSSQPLTRTRRGTVSKCAEEPGQENKDLNVAMTPALPSGRRRAAAASAYKKVDSQMTVNIENENNLGQEKNDIPETPAVPNSQKRVAAASARRKTESRNNGTTEQRVTRRSIRLLEKNMESLSLMEDRKTDPIAVHLSFEEMPKSTGPEKESYIEIGSKKTDDSESKSDAEQNISTAEDDLELEIDDQEQEKDREKNETKVEPEMDPDISTCSAATLASEKCPSNETSKDMNDYGTDAPNNNLDVKCFSKDEGTKEDSKDPEVSAEDIKNATELSLYPQNVDVTKVDNLINLEHSGTEVVDGQNESTCESEDTVGEDFDYEALDAEIEEAKFMSNSTKLSPPHENVGEETEVDDLSTGEESVMKVEDSTTGEIFGYKGEALDADIEGNKKDLEMISVQAEDVTKEDKDYANVDRAAIQPSRAFHHEDSCNNVNLPSSFLIEKPTVEMVEYVSEDLVDIKIQFLMDDKAPKDLNDALDSQPKMFNDVLDSQLKILDNIECETLVDVSVTSTEAFPISSNIGGISLVPFAADQLPGQFPRPTVTKSPVKEQTTKLRMDISDTEEEEEEEGAQEQTVEKKDLSLRQLRKIFKEQLQLSKKKMDKRKVGKVRTALQPLPENRMDMNEVENRF